MKTVSEMKVLLAEKKLNDSFARVYTEDAFDAQYSRFLNVLESFEKRFSQISVRFSKLFGGYGKEKIMYLEELQEKIHYKFRDVKWLEVAMTHSSYANEMKHSTQYNERLEFLGDSILGFKSHMGAGSLTSNVKSDKTLVVVKNGEESIETGLKKFGAMLGDCVEVGCNSVLNPGTVVGRCSNIYPLSCVRGVVPAQSIYKTGGQIVKKV